jgi:hypothetical protein
MWMMFNRLATNRPHKARKHENTKDHEIAKGKTKARNRIGFAKIKKFGTSQVFELRWLKPWSRANKAACVLNKTNNNDQPSLYGWRYWLGASAVVLALVAIGFGFAGRPADGRSKVTHCRVEGLNKTGS